MPKRIKTAKKLKKRAILISHYDRFDIHPEFWHKI